MQKKKFIRFVKLLNKKVQTIKQDVSSLGKNEIYADMFNGFETRENKLSLFEFNNESEKERIIVNFDITKNKCKTISDKISFIIIGSDELENLGLVFSQSNINEYYDILAKQNHYDITNLVSSNVISFIQHLNNSNIETASRNDLRRMIKTSISNNNISWPGNSSEFDEYKNKVFNK